MDIMGRLGEGGVIGKIRVMVMKRAEAWGSMVVMVMIVIMSVEGEEG